jgi:hypothetical protein
MAVGDIRERCDIIWDGSINEGNEQKRIVKKDVSGGIMFFTVRLGREGDKNGTDE